MVDQTTPQKVTCAHVFISGQVQGVGYRASTRDMAKRLNLTGWVRNLRDGRVEALFEGSAGAIDEILRWCHEGPPSAVVNHIEVQYEDPKGLKSFEVVR
ncbi:MAG: acylphosphatase [Elainellaceae cyanobacterium]